MLAKILGGENGAAVPFFAVFPKIPERGGIAWRRAVVQPTVECG